ncbi:MAG: hypothetical protein IJX20_04500 [Alphaproteobacteria bacterium]|nr:hypothetical protein [Alphaproteobacteria bacterium]
MIEIILDGNADDEFCGQKYSVIEVASETLNSWTKYKQLAQQIIVDYAKELAVIIKLENPNIFLNKLAVALFVESLTTPNQLQYAVFKVKNLQQSREQYKPYAALTIAIKYALNLANENHNTIYKNISELGYLGIETEQDYTTNILVLTLPNSDSTPLVITSNNLEDTICGVALLKALSLAQIKFSIILKIERNETEISSNKDVLVEKIIQNASPWIN